MQIIETGFAPRVMPRWFKYLLASIGAVIFIAGALVWRVETKYADKIIELSQIEPPQVGLVFGAGLRAKGVPGVVLEDRILTAVKIFQEGKIARFIMSGDNTSVNHNEVQAMKNFALEQGLPEESIILDHAGASTYDSCARLKSEYSLERIVLVTQRYHLRRALYLCNELGIDAYGVAAADRGYAKQWQYTWREWLASAVAFFTM